MSAGVWRSLVGLRSIGDGLLFLTPPLLGFATGPILARTLGPDGRGQLAAALAVAALATSIGSVGQFEVALNDLRERRTDSLVTRGLAAITAGLIASSLGEIWAALVHSKATAIALLPVSALCGVAVQRARCIAAGRTRALGTERTLGAVLRVAALASFAAAGVLTADTAVSISVITTVLGALALFRIPTRRLRTATFSRSWYPSFSLMSIANSIRLGAPLASLAVLTAVMLRMDQIGLGQIRGPTELGLYSAGVGIAEVALAVSAAIKVRAQEQLVLERQLTSVRPYLRLTLSLGIAGCVGAFFLGDQVVGLLLGHEFQRTAVILKILAPASLFQMLFDIRTGCLAVLGDRVGMLYAAGAGAVVTAIAIVPAILWWGGAGAAAASLVAYLACERVAAWRMIRAIRQPILETTVIGRN